MGIGVARLAVGAPGFGSGVWRCIELGVLGRYEAVVFYLWGM